MNDAVSAARAALNGKWRTMGATGRRNLILKLAQLVEENVEPLSILERYKRENSYIKRVVRKGKEKMELGK